MKLQILVPQYKETDEVVKPLLDSLAIQQNVDFSEIGVIICNDGTDVKLSADFLNSYPFKVDYHQCEHRGVSATRNACLDRATAKYVMFCDADDMFYSAIALRMLFDEMDKGNGFDALISVFVEESRHPETKMPIYINRVNDVTFVHGKVYSLDYLKRNKIRWNDKLTVHEDSYFNCLCRLLVGHDRGRYCQNSFYLWKWRDESVCRHDPLYLNKTYVNMLDSNSELIRELIKRGMQDAARFYSVSMIYDVYYSLNHDRWWSEEGHEYLERTERRFKEYWQEFKHFYENSPEPEQMQIVSGIRNRFFKEGLKLERITFADWIKHIEAM